MRQECTKHSVQKVAVRFVGIFRLGCHAYIRADVKADMSALMNKRGDLLIEYSNQVASLSGVGVFIVTCQAKIEWSLVSTTAKELISVLILLSGHCKIDVCTLKQRDSVRR